MKEVPQRILFLSIGIDDQGESKCNMVNFVAATGRLLREDLSEIVLSHKLLD